MKKFEIMRTHDTQQRDLSGEMLTAIRESLEELRFSLITITFNGGLTIIKGSFFLRFDAPEVDWVHSRFRSVWLL
jgi:hypothetical protein